MRTTHYHNGFVLQYRIVRCAVSKGCRSGYRSAKTNAAPKGAAFIHTGSLLPLPAFSLFTEGVTAIHSTASRVADTDSHIAAGYARLNEIGGRHYYPGIFGLRVEPGGREFVVFLRAKHFVQGALQQGQILLAQIADQRVFYFPFVIGIAANIKPVKLGFAGVFAEPEQRPAAFRFTLFE